MISTRQQVEGVESRSRLRLRERSPGKIARKAVPGTVPAGCCFEMAADHGGIQSGSVIRRAWGLTGIPRNATWSPDRQKPVTYAAAEGRDCACASGEIATPPGSNFVGRMQRGCGSKNSRRRRTSAADACTGLLIFSEPPKEAQLLFAVDPQTSFRQAALFLSYASP
jgi:hypothetical protein